MAAARRRTALTDSRYRAGLSAQLDVLVAREAEARIDVERAVAEADAARAFVALNVALGLGAG
jgi:outer membrane protein TolC